MRILITGITGFAGQHLADFLSDKKNLQIFGLSRAKKTAAKNIFTCDIRDQRKLESVLSQVKPDRIFHLAAQASVPFSWQHPLETFEQNLIGTVNLLEGARLLRKKPKILIAGSAQEYGRPQKNTLRLDEETPMNPESPYAVSKVSQDLLAQQYIAHYGINIVRTRAFNHIGPRQSTDFLTSSISRQIALIEAGRQKPVILMGNLDTVRDYTDVRDVVRAYWLALEKGKMGEVYNIASGEGHTARQILNICLKLSSVKIAVKTDPFRVRKSDLPRLVGDARKFKIRTGWSARISFEDSLRDILEFWRENIKLERHSE